MMTSLIQEEQKRKKWDNSYAIRPKNPQYSQLRKVNFSNSRIGNLGGGVDSAFPPTLRLGDFAFLLLSFTLINLHKRFNFV